MEREILHQGRYARDIRDIKEQIKTLADAFQMEYSSNLLLLYEQFSYVLIFRCFSLKRRNDVVFLKSLPQEDVFQISSMIEGPDEKRLKEQEIIQMVERAVIILSKYAASSGSIPLKFLSDAKFIIANAVIARRMVQLADKIIGLINETSETSFLLKEFMTFTLEQCRGGKSDNNYETPGHIAELIINLVKDNLIQPSLFGTKILNPACGSGSFLLAANELIKAELSLSGYEKNESLRRIAALNCMFNGINAVISDDMEYMNSEYDIVLSNPPFRNIKQYCEDLENILKFIAPGGCGAVIVPDSYLFNSQSDAQKARGKILQIFNIEGIVSLPSSTFYPLTSANASILFLSKRVKENWNEYATQKIFFYEVKDLSKNKSLKPSENDSFSNLLSLWPKREFFYGEWEFHLKTDSAYNLSEAMTPANWPYKNFWFADINEIKAGKWSLLPERYRPVERLEIAVEPPSDILAELMSLQEEIAKDMAWLLREVGRN